MVREIRWATLEGDPFEVRLAQSIREKHRMELHKLRSEVESAETITDQAQKNRVNILKGIQSLEEETSAAWWINQEEVGEAFLLILKKLNEIASRRESLRYRCAAFADAE